MANEKNLRVPSSSEARENGKKGGKASGEARRAKKTMREQAELLLSLPVSDLKKYNKLARMGIPLENIDNKMLIVAALLAAASDGDVPAAKELRNIIGEDRETGDSDELRKAKELLGGVDSVI